MRQSLPAVLSAMALAVAAFAAGFAARGLTGDRAEEFAVLREAHLLLVENYLGPLPSESALEHGSIRGMLAPLEDPFTTFVEPAAHELQADSLAGQYAGIGASFTRDQAGSLHLVPLPDGPAELAGVLEGDILLSVDDREVSPSDSLDDVAAWIRGPAGTTVTLRVVAPEPGSLARRVPIVREEFAIPSVNGYLLPDDPTVGVLAITIFSERTPEEVGRSLDDLRARGALRLIVDLRGNPGGLLTACVDTARVFLPSGQVVVVEVERDSGERVYRTLANGEGSDLPLAVVVDGATASAAEIFAGAIQANRRAPLIGAQTFGKGSVQSIFELEDGSSLHVTSARWLTPDRVSLDGVGLAPDVPVDPAHADSPADPFLAAAAAWLGANPGGMD